MRLWIAFVLCAVVIAFSMTDIAHGEGPVYKVMLVPSPSPSPSAPTPTPSPAPRPTALYLLPITSPPPATHPAQNVFYVLSDGKADAATMALVLRSMVARLEDQIAKRRSNVWVIPRADWTLSDFTNACLSGTPALGGIVFMNILSNQGTENYLLWAYGWTRINANTLLLSCPAVNANAQQSAVPPTLPYIVDVQNGMEGGGYRNGFPFTVAAGVASLFNQNKNATTTTITQPATPAPGTTPNPLATMTTTTTTTNVNPNSALVLASVTSSLGSISAPAINQPAAASVAAWHVADLMMERVYNRCVRKAAVPGDPTPEPLTPQLQEQCDQLGLMDPPVRPRQRQAPKSK